MMNFRFFRLVILFAVLGALALIMSGCAAQADGDDQSADSKGKASQSDQQKPEDQAKKGTGPRVHADPPLLNEALYTELQMKEQVRKAALHVQSLYADNEGRYGATKEVITYLSENGIAAKPLKGPADCLNFQNSLAVGVWAQGEELNLCVTSPEDASPIFYRDDLGQIIQS